MKNKNFLERISNALFSECQIQKDLDRIKEDFKKTEAKLAEQSLVFEKIKKQVEIHKNK